MGRKTGNFAMLVLISHYLLVTTIAIREKPQDGEENIGAHIRVTILNTLPSNQTLTLHCKSGNQDLGVQYVAVNQSFSWKFRVNFFLTTLYFCGFNWHAASGRFDIYKAKRDLRRCAHYCDWEVRDDGVYGFTQIVHNNDITFFWPPGPPSARA